MVGIKFYAPNKDAKASFVMDKVFMSEDEILALAMLIPMVVPELEFRGADDIDLDCRLHLGMVGNDAHDEYNMKEAVANALPKLVAGLEKLFPEDTTMKPDKELAQRLVNLVKRAQQRR